MQSRKGFTLIELLVVIAIIAILAAILFPVFASAKEAGKKTVMLSNTKQTALSFVLYASDNEDRLPLTFRVEGNTILAHEVPAGWANPANEALDGVLWANSTFPYRKNGQLLRIDGLLNWRLAWGPYPGNYATPNKPPQTTSLSMNGLLHAYSLSEIASPSRLTLAWWGNMREQIEGYAFTNPHLNCGTPVHESCRFNPTGPASPTATGVQGDFSWAPYNPAADSAWVLGKGMVFVSVDTSARFRNLNPSGARTPVGQMNRNYDDPTMRYLDNAQQLTYHRCNYANGQTRYFSFFRPDSEFNYAFGNSSTTRCRP